MLTGDKLETAQNIGYSCRLLDGTLELVKIDESTQTKVTGLVIAETTWRC